MRSEIINYLERCIQQTESLLKYSKDSDDIIWAKNELFGYENSLPFYRISKSSILATYKFNEFSKEFKHTLVPNPTNVQACLEFENFTRLHYYVGLYKTLENLKKEDYFILNLTIAEINALNGIFQDVLKITAAISYFADQDMLFLLTNVNNELMLRLSKFLGNTN